jgi:drug/metabolite transporter (DMT)-like permease
VTAVIGGLGAALAWALAAVAASRSTRLIGPASALGCGVLVGIAILAVPLAVAGVPDPDAESIAWLVVSGAGNMVGLLLLYMALRVGKIGVVVPIGATCGGIAALVAVAAGETVSAGIAAALVALAGGAVLASMTRADADDAAKRVAPGVVFAAAAALAWGIAIYAGGRLADESEVPLAWILLSSRAFGVLFVTVPFAATGRLRFARPALPFVVVAGVGEVAGYALFLWGARESIPVSSVLAGQNAALAAVIAFLLFGERLTRVQAAGVALIAAGIASLAVLQA